MPPAALRVGDFSQAFNSDGSLQVIYDPTTGNAGRDGPAAVPRQRHPGEPIDPIAKKIQDLYPDANLAGRRRAATSAARRSRATTCSDAAPQVRSQQLRLQGQLQPVVRRCRSGASTRTWARRVDSPQALPRRTTAAATGDTTVNQYTFGTTWTLNPTTVFDATYGISKMTHESHRGRLSARQLRSGHAGHSRHERRRQLQQRPALRRHARPSLTSGFSTVGNDDGWDPVQRDERTYAFDSQPDEAARQPRVPVRLLAEPAAHGPLAAGARVRAARCIASSRRTRRRSTAARRRRTSTTATRRSCSAWRTTPAPSVQNELMTTREWQHGLYVRDRWQVNNKLTLDLGLRYEYYPLMTACRPRHRAGGPEHLERPPRRRRRQSEGPRDQGQQDAVRAAPRRRLPHQRQHGVPRRLRHHLQPAAVLAAAARLLSADARDEFTTTRSVSARSPRSSTAFRTSSGPDLSSGTHPAAELVRHAHAGWTTCRAAGFSRGTSRSSGGCRTTSPWTWPTSARAKNGGFADLDVNASDDAGRRRRQPAVLPDVRAQQLAAAVGTADEVALPLAAGGDQPSVQERPAAEGRLHAVAREERDRRRRVGGADVERSEPADRNYALAGYDRPHVFQMAFVYELPYKTTARQKDVAHLIFGDWQVNGIFSAYSGTPFTITANGAQAQHAGQHADGGPEWVLQRDRQARPAGSYFDPTAFSQPQGVASATPAGTSSAGRAAWNLDFSLFRAFPVGGGPKRVEFRMEVFNLLNSPEVGQPRRRRQQLHFRSDVHRVGNGSARCGHRRASDSARCSVPVLEPGCRLRAPGSGPEQATPRRRGLRSSPAFSRTDLAALRIRTPIEVSVPHSALRIPNFPLYSRLMRFRVAALAVLVLASAVASAGANRCRAWRSTASPRLRDGRSGARTMTRSLTRTTPPASAISAMVLQAWEQFDTASVVYARARDLERRFDWFYLGGLVETRLAHS